MKKNCSIKRMIALLAMIALMTIMFAGSALAAGYVQATGGHVNVRSGPGTNYTDLYTLVKGESVEYLGVSQRDGNGQLWYKVQYYSYGTGWVSAQHSKLVGASSGGSSSGSTSGGSYVQASGGNVNIRNTPSLTGKDLGTIHNGEKATYLGQSSVDDRGVVWYKVSFNGVTGWASSRYSKLVGGSSYGDVSLPDFSDTSSSGSYVQASGGDVNIRNIPSLTGKDMGTIHDGEIAEYLGQSSVDDRGVVWYKVCHNGVIGWASSRYSKLVGSSYSGSTGYSDRVKATGGDSNIRTQPSLSGKSIGVMHKGESGVYLDQSSVDDRGVVWYKVSFEGQTGWVSSRYCDVY